MQYIRMSATYRNIFSLLQHFCAQHPAAPIYPISLETFVTYLGNSPTLNFFRPPGSRGGKECKLSKPWCPIGKTCPTTLPGVCTHLYTYAHTKRGREEVQLLHLTTASCWQRHNLLISTFEYCGCKPKYQPSRLKTSFYSLPYILSLLKWPQ